ncbi:insulinase family protein [Chryseobacterium salipaludis]|uniref:M16 family metallopeptidase n=1 Tax=Chryseobacterium TaxID=59732 RepID=UPI001FF6859A|nr:MULTISPECIES: M16 family metallopeptidase [Chryseobacterium]MCJ8497659.1 insulinase family protein [Chryseobacterium salipaludis]MCX3296068.1 insulinase family protein [Planobacterium sp. JC490]
MFKKKILMLFAAAVIFSAQAQDYQWKEATAGGYTYKYVTNDPSQARFYTLKNGLTVILSPTKKDPRIQAYVATKAGSKTDPATNTGLAHYLEHLLFKGTDKYGSLDWAKEKPELDKIDALYEQYNKTKDEANRKAIYKQIDSVSGVASKYAIANEYDKMMSAMGAQGTNAWTSFEETVYTDDVPASSLDKYLAVQAERFRNPQLRIFHTELEAVYEEKNRSLDNDGGKVFETLFSTLFQNHNYGKQTTIGTIEHLKNPSLVEIRKYFNTYYVPNNMGVILSGDFDPDQAIAKIDRAFSYMQSKPVPKYTFQQEVPFNAPVIKEITGPDAESVAIGFRLPGNKDKDVLLADLVGAILTNGKAGLLDLNLVKKQRLLRASAFTFTLQDHGVLWLNASPTSGQTLEDVQKLVLNEIENLKKGNFDADLLPSIVNNIKKDKIEETEKYSGRASNLVNAFTSELDWKDQVAYVNDLSKIKKEDVVAFANRYLGNNYVAVLKRKGETKNNLKIEKPAITPVETNADKQSAFVKMVNDMPNTPSAPVFLDFEKDIQKAKMGKAEVLYVPNTENDLYRLRYRYKIGAMNDLKQPLAAQYIQFLGTDKKSAEDISKEFYKIASSFNVATSEEYTTVTIEGLQENFGKAVQLYEDLVLNAKPSEEALAALKARLAKARKDAKSNKGAILQGLTSYAMYGPKNKFNHTLTDAQLNAVTAQELVDRIKNLNQYEQTVIYYGPESLKNLTAQLGKMHKVPAKFATAAPMATFKQQPQTKNQVLFTDYDMVQAETRWIRNTDVYDPAKTTLVNVFNNYFGGGMGGIVFQTIRESKALAYSTYGVYVQPQKKSDQYYMMSYVGSQADKFNDAVGAMNELLTKMPELPVNLELAKNKVKKDIQTERIMEDNIIFRYLAAKELGLKDDIRKQMYTNVDNVTMADLKNFHANNFSGKPYTYALVASEKNVKMEDLKKIGEVKKISLEELFGF